MKNQMKLTLRDFQNLMTIIEKGHSNRLLGELIGRCGSTVNGMIGTLMKLGYIDDKIDMKGQVRTYKILKADLSFEEIKEYIGNAIVERQRLVGDQVNDSLELQILPHKKISLNFTGMVSTVNYGF